MAYPSGHSAYAVALVACAVVLARGGHNLATRFALVTIAIALALGVAASRVYLRVHYLSDVIGGLALGTAIFSLAGIVALVVGALRNNGGPMSNDTLTVVIGAAAAGHLRHRLARARAGARLDVLLARLGAPRGDGPEPVRAGGVRARRIRPRRRDPLVLRRDLGLARSRA